MADFAEADFDRAIAPSMKQIKEMVIQREQERMEREKQRILAIESQNS